MITLTQYAGLHKDAPDWTRPRQATALVLLDKVNALMMRALADGIVIAVNPKTQSEISGELYGGFRPQDCPIGAPGSSHKMGKAVDVFDPRCKFAAWCVRNKSELANAGLYMENPKVTPGWVHLQTTVVPSGNVIFNP